MKRKEVTEAEQLNENPLAFALMAALVGMGLEKEKAKKAAAQAVNDAKTGAWKDPDKQPAAARPAPQGADYNKIMKRGSRGEGVKELQRNLGMTGSEIDGIFGPATEKAVKTFQQNSGAKVDGIVGPETRGMIEKYANSPDKDPTRVNVQQPQRKPSAVSANKPWRAVNPQPPGYGRQVNKILITDGSRYYYVGPDPKNGRYIGGGPVKMQNGKPTGMVGAAGFYVDVNKVDMGGKTKIGPKVGDPITPEYQKILQQKLGDGGMVGEPMTQADVNAIMGESVVASKKQIDEASININGADASEVAEILRMMQLAGAGDAKVVGPDDINQGPKPCPICGKMHGPSQPMGGCGSKPKEPGMGDMIKLMAPEEGMAEEEGPMGDEYDDEPSAPDEEYANDVSASIPSGNDLHKEKGSYPATAGGDNPMALEDQIKERLMQAFETYKDRDAYDASQQSGRKVTLPKAPWEKDHDAEDGEKPDHQDVDGDGNEKESWKDAEADKKAKAASK